MKCSQYNIFFEKDNQKYVFNAKIGLLSKIDDEFSWFYEAVQADPNFFSDSQCFITMCDSKVLINDKEDELQEILSNCIYEDDGSLKIVIAPTLSCNFCCPYCYEKRELSFMSTETSNNLVAVIKRLLAGRKSLVITWFGGEPLLATNIITSISAELIEFCDKSNIKYSAGIVTNGYLINEKTINIIKECKIHCVEVTLDGYCDSHDRKKHTYVGERTYSKLINNIRLLVQNNILVNVKINIEESNHHDMKNILGDLEDFTGRINIVFGFLSQCTADCGDIAYMSKERFSKLHLGWFKMLIDRKFVNCAEDFYPRQTKLFCSAAEENAFLVDPKGLLYKCFTDIGNETEAYGNVFKDELEITNQNNYTKYTKKLDVSKECSECKILSICLGGCPYKNNNSKRECILWKYILVDYLKMLV